PAFAPYALYSRCPSYRRHRTIRQPDVGMPPAFCTRETAAAIASTAKSTSAAVVNRPSPRRIEAFARSPDKPGGRRTREGTTLAAAMWREPVSQLWQPLRLPGHFGAGQRRGLAEADAERGRQCPGAQASL